MLLVLVSAVADLPEAMNENCTRQARVRGG
jgi:hypothetical protein